jgi:transcriptional regulator with XRE-family HTH domain
MILLRTHIGSALRAARIEQDRTLRDVAKSARVSLGYLSEVERGQKEASSELLNAICTALDLSLSTILADVANVVRAHEAPIPTLQVVETAA